MRLLILYCFSNNGIKPKLFDSYRKMILQVAAWPLRSLTTTKQAYGYEYVFTLENLEKLGLVRKQESR